MHATQFFLVVSVLTMVFGVPADAAPVPLPDGRQVREVDFERHVQAILSRQGCNAGACYGSFQGKGGFSLSLFAYALDKDYTAFSRDALGRRINVATPDQSLMLLKATGQVAHGGERRFGKNSWQYQVVREWIAGGAGWKPGSGGLACLWITPAEHRFARVGESRQLQVEAEFSDGSWEVVTCFCEFKVGDDAIASVSPGGLVRALRPGDTPIIVSYRGHAQPVRMLVPRPVATDFRYPLVLEVNFIDREVFAKLRQLNIVPSERSSDTEFLRRVTIDTIGCLPTPGRAKFA